MDIYSILQSKPHNPHYLSRYYKFILACNLHNTTNNIIKRKKNSIDDYFMDSHHICPKAHDLFPEYTSFKKYPWNKVDLTPRQHFIAHMILWKLYGGSQKFSFRMLSNCSGKITSKNL